VPDEVRPAGYLPGVADQRSPDRVDVHLQIALNVLIAFEVAIATGCGT
jgi:hypothetical protein